MFSVLNTLLIAMLATGSIYADNREGINFGLSFHVDAGTESNDLQGTREYSVESAKPYLGYVVTENLNLGISALFESHESKEQYTTIHGDSVERHTQSRLQGTQVFARFMFAGYMFFEGGFGLYANTKSTHMLERQGHAQGTFEETNYQQKAVGYGHHLGIGVEIPVTNGFFVTTAFNVRSIDFRDEKSDGSVGVDKTSIQKRELAFGISHYVE